MLTQKFRFFCLLIPTSCYLGVHPLQSLLGGKIGAIESLLWCFGLLTTTDQNCGLNASPDLKKSGKSLGGGSQIFMILKSIKTQLSKHILSNIRAVRYSEGLPRWLGGKESARQSGRHRKCRFSPWARRSPGEGNGDPLQCSCLENPVDKGAWQATVRGVAKSRKKI